MRQSLVGLINFWRKKQPKRMAIITPSGSLTYSQLWIKASVFAEQLMQKNNAFIGIATSRQELTIVAMVAIMLCKKRFLILDSTSPSFNEVVKASKIDSIITDLSFDSNLDIEIITIDNYSYASASETKFDYSIDMYDDVGAFLSSGTTGVPKVFVRSNYSLVSEAFLWIFELQLTTKTRFYLNSPLAYIGSFVLLYSVLYSGGTVLLNNVGESFRKAQVSYAFYTVKEINSILDEYQGKELPIAAKKVLTMGAPIDYETKRKFADLYHCDVLEMWGNSEGLATLISMNDSHAMKGSIGRSTFTDDLFITDKDGKRLKPFQVGYISGVTDNDTSSSISEVIISEDLGYMDDEEYFYLVGRETNVILFSDNKFFSTIQFEKYIREHGQVDECAVTICADRIHINVFYVSKTAIEIDSLCVQYLRAISENLILGKTIKLDELPYNNNGKINYLALNQLLEI